MTCERVVIINRGRIAAIDTPENLTYQLKGGDRIEVEVSGPVETFNDLLDSLPGIQRITLEKSTENRFKFSIESEGEEIRHLVARKLVENGFDLYQIRSESMTLEEVFLTLTTEEDAA